MKPTLRQACSRPRPRAQFAFKDSMIHIICNSHYVSHFAAFFIDTGAKISVVESCLWFEGSAVSFEAGVRSASDLMRQGSVGVWSQPEPRESSALERASSLGRHRLTLPTDRSQSTGSRRTLLRWQPLSSGEDVISRSERTARGDGCSRGKVFDRCNDPSAGSPTETLLRLLLPLGGRV